jgi:hypothetical protein
MAFGFDNQNASAFEQGVFGYARREGIFLKSGFLPVSKAEEI